MRTHLDEAVALFTQAGSLGGVGLCRMFDGQVYLRSGDLLRAAERLEEWSYLLERDDDVPPHAREVVARWFELALLDAIVGGAQRNFAEPRIAASLLSTTDR